MDRPMNPNPCPGQRWLWDFKQRSIDSSCVFEVTKVGDGQVYFKYVQIIHTNYSEYVGQESRISASHLNDTVIGTFLYLAGQDSPRV